MERTKRTGHNKPGLRQLGWKVDGEVFNTFVEFCHSRGWQFRDVIEPIMLVVGKIVDHAGLNIKRPGDLEWYVTELLRLCKPPQRPPLG